MNKVCTKCYKEKSLEDFPIRKETRDGRRNICKECIREYCHNRYRMIPNVREASLKATKKWGDKHPECRKKINQKQSLKRHYGITLEEYAEMLTKQNGVCASCGDPPNGRKLSVDHNHETDEIRGLLCDRCNFALGQLKEDPIRIKRLLNYLQKWEGAIV